MTYQEFVARAMEYAMIHGVSFDAAVEILHQTY